jgi:GrpB-like predicted nucleotidyltransferase (UPF0157 family)
LRPRLTDFGLCWGSRALRIEQAGSTSVPGLAAKSIVDLVLVIADSAEEEAYAPDLEAAGYALRIREPGWYEHRMFKGPDTDINLHVFSSECPEIDRMLIFRDLYARTKLALARREWKDVQDYADAKSAVVDDIVARGCKDGKSRIKARCRIWSGRDSTDS